MCIVYFEPRALYFDREHHQASVGRKILATSANRNYLWQLFINWIKDKTTDDLHVRCYDPEKCFHALAKNFTLIEAAGGVVENPSSDILMIFRLGKWDLPKGKIDQGEEPHTAAIREVEEECAISKLQINKSLPPTYHVYHTTNNGWILKKTHWYSMQVDKHQLPNPQLSENITKAVWVQKKQAKELLDQAYRSISDLLSLYISLRQ